MLDKKHLLGLCVLAGLAIPGFGFADNLIHTTIETGKQSTFGLAWGNLDYYKIDRCEGKSLKGWQWSGKRCYLSSKVNDNAWAPLAVVSADEKSWCDFTLTVVDIPGQQFYEKLMDSDTRCHGKFSGIRLEKVSDYQYQLKVSESGSKI